MKEVLVKIRKPTTKEGESNDLEKFFGMYRKPIRRWVYAVEFPGGRVHYTANDSIRTFIEEYKQRNNLI